MKQCSRCEKIKDKDMFHKRRLSKDGLQCYCKQCAYALVKMRPYNKKYSDIYKNPHSKAKVEMELRKNQLRVKKAEKNNYLPVVFGGHNTI